MSEPIEVRSASSAVRRAEQAEKTGMLLQAERICRSILDRFPANQRAAEMAVRISALRRQRRSDAPAPAFQVSNLIEIFNRGQVDEVIAQAEEILDRFPNTFLLAKLLATALLITGKNEASVERFRAAASLNPTDPTLYNDLGLAFRAISRHDDAASSFRRAIELDPGFSQAHNNLGRCLQDMGENVAAAAAFRSAIAVDPVNAEAYVNLGNALRATNMVEEAFAAFERGLELKPDSAEFHFVYGNALLESERHSEGRAAFSRAIAIKPEFDLARARLLAEHAGACDWSKVDQLRGGTDFVDGTVSPFLFLALDDDPEFHRALAEKFGLSQAVVHDPLPDYVRPASFPNKISVGYFSSDFHDHATMHLMARMFELHDPEKFDIHVFSYGRDSDDAFRRRLLRAVPNFHEVSALSDRAIAAKAREMGLHVAVDLKGYTRATRTGLFAYRPAPVQIAYIGYPGTSAASFIDYAIADRIVIPHEENKNYSEKIIRLPDSYQVNDDTRGIEEDSSSRAEEGLPEEAFVFCCFNNTLKIQPREFSIWMRLLIAVPDAVLWLLASNDEARSNLRREAERLGVDPARLVFAERRPLARHLARHRHADLFLDTFNYNAHTTASDALWAGLPVLTKTGRSFAARVSASLLHALGVPELVAADEEHYERLALNLASDRTRLQALKTKVQELRASSPLFDSLRSTRTLEAAYRAAYERFARGLPPDHIDVRI